MGRAPKDYDLFLLGNAMPAMEWDAGLELVFPPQWRWSSPHLLGTVRYDDALVQVCRTKAHTLDELVDTFDWNVCLYGWEPRRTLAWTDVQNIGPGKPLRLHSVHTPAATLRRGYRFSERFEMTLDTRELADLCTMSAASLIHRLPKPDEDYCRPMLEAA